MAAKGIHKPPTPIPKAPVRDQFQFGPWTCTSLKSHILKSEGHDREKFEAELNLPHLPEMVFDKNCLHLEHQGGFGIAFNALDALRLVDDKHDSLKVAEADEWLAARADNEHIRQVIKPFDWTFTTEYMGTVFGKDDAKFEITETDETINIEKLKKRDKIHFLAELLLFEDELHDNGTSMLDVKIRVMPDYFFILLRQFVRVDQVVIRINDTRIYHEVGTDYMLRECTHRESRIADLKLDPHFFTDPILVCDHLKKKVDKVEKMKFPAKYANTNTTLPSSRSSIPATVITSGT